MARPGRPRPRGPRDGVGDLVQRLAAGAGVDRVGGAAGRGVEPAEQPSGGVAQDPRGPGPAEGQRPVEAVEGAADCWADAGVDVEREYCDFCRGVWGLGGGVGGWAGGVG